MDSIPQDHIPFKQCSGPCRRTLPATLEYFHYQKLGRYGVRSLCKKCTREGKHSTKKVVPPEGQKHCYKCSTSYPATTQFFHRDQDCIGGLFIHCKTCANAEFRASKERHREKRRVKDREYERLHKDEIRIRKARYYLMNVDWMHERGKRYRQTEQGKLIHVLGENRRRARKQSAEGELTIQQVQVKLKAQKHKCYYCFSPFKKRNSRYIFHIEHTIPLSRTEYEPRHDVNFIVLACPLCNQRKHNKLPHEWSEGGRLF